jgi:hypothetical protein
MDREFGGPPSAPDNAAARLEKAREEERVGNVAARDSQPTSRSGGADYSFSAFAARGL